MQNTVRKVVYSFSRPLKSVNTEKNGLATNCDAKLFENFDSKFFIVGVQYLSHVKVFMYSGEPTNFYMALYLNNFVPSTTNLKKNLIFFYENRQDLKNRCRLYR